MDVEQPYRCKACGSILAFTTPERLSFGRATCRLEVTLECDVCKHRQKWRPSPGPKHAACNDDASRGTPVGERT